MTHLTPDTAKRTKDLYSKDPESVAHAVRQWAIANGNNPKMRIALCGYEGEHAMPKSWECLALESQGRIRFPVPQKNNNNANRERIWFSESVLSAVTPALTAALTR